MGRLVLRRRELRLTVATAILLAAVALTIPWLCALTWGGVQLFRDAKPGGEGSL